MSGNGLEASLRAALEELHVSAHRRGRRAAQKVIHAVGPTPVENLGAAIMTVGAQQDLGVGPVGADRAQQPAQEGLDLLAAGPFGGTKNGGEAPSRPIQPPPRPETLFFLIGAEHPLLLDALDLL